MAYRFLDDERTHWLAGEHAIAAWVGSIDWTNTVVVAHHVRFDGAILAWRYGVRPFAWMDTVGLAKAVLGELVPSYTLKRLAEHLKLPPKGEISCEGLMHPTPEQLATLGEYCKNDVEICKAIYEKLMPSFPISQLEAIDWTIRCFLEPKLVLDLAILEKGVIDEKKRREEVIKLSGIDRDVLSSNTKFADYLAKRGIPVPTKVSGRTGKKIPAFAKTDEGLAQLQLSHPAIHAARLASKANLLETRGESLIDVGKTGPFPFDIGFSGAKQTHRLSGGSGAGGNPQNFTRGSFLRTAICAPVGYELVVGDFAAVELRLLAWLAREPKLMSKILNDEDIYSDFASLKYGRTITKANKIERQFGKCLAEGTQVLTNAGWKNIELVGLDDRLWDGEEWVEHKGLQYNGQKDVIGLDGLFLTPDHQVLCGTDWKESRFLAQDKSSLCRALATGSERLPSQVMSKEFGEELSVSCDVATVGPRKMLLKPPTYEPARPGDAMNARKSLPNQPENCIGVTLPTWPTMNTARAFLIAYRQLLLGAITQITGNTSTMGLEEYPSAKTGGEIAALSYPMSSLSLVGLFHRLKWIESTLMEITNQATSDSYLNLLISVIKERLKISKPKLPVFDLLSAGPRNRFTVLTARGPLIVHNCSILGLGYSMAAKKFRLTVKAQTGMDISEDDSWKTVELYRETYFNVPKLWQQMQDLLPFISAGSIGCIWFAPSLKVKKDTIVLPSGLQIRYPNLRYGWYMDKKWSKKREGWHYDAYFSTYSTDPVGIYGGMIVENICQALAGELTKDAIARIEAQGVKCVGQIHDEIIALAPVGKEKEIVTLVKAAMEVSPTWMPTIRLKSEVGHGANWGCAKV